MSVNQQHDPTVGSPQAAREPYESQRRLAELKKELLQEITDALDRLLVQETTRQYEAPGEAEAFVRQLLSAMEAKRASALAAQDDDAPPFVVRPWPYLCAMFNIAKGAFLHPWQTTVVDLETGAVVN